MKNIYSTLVDELDKEETLALATIIETNGSTPQVQGASAIFSGKGLVAGTLGGGILEGEAQKMALYAIQSETSLVFDYNLATDIEDEEGALCGGNVRILTDNNTAEQKKLFADIDNSLSNNKAGVLSTHIKFIKENQVQVQRTWIEDRSGDPSITDNNLRDHKENIILCLRDKSCQLHKIRQAEQDDDETNDLLFFQSLYPLPKLYIAGAGHIGKALSHLANLLDFEVTVIDDREQYANPQNLPDADSIIVNPVGAAMEKIDYGPDTYVVIVTRDHKDDGAALRGCIQSNTSYLGMIGSKRKIRLMREEFIDKGWATVEQFDRVYAPIGLDIQSKTVQEIAISICAQLVLIRQQNVPGKKKPVISALILAAGESKRMGQPKMVIPFGKTTVIEQVIRETARSRADHIHVVTGAFPDIIKEKIKSYTVSHSENKNYSSGMITSIQCGIDSLRKDITAIILLLGDQPMIRSSVIDDLITAYNNSDKGIIRASYNGEHGHPVIIDKKYFTEILRLTEKNNLRDLMHAHPDDILEVNTDSPEILRDIDTVEDYENEIKHLNNHD